MCVAELRTMDVEVKEENEVMEVATVTKPAASPECGPQVVDSMRKVREAMYVCTKMVISESL